MIHHNIIVDEVKYEKYFKYIFQIRCGIVNVILYFIYQKNHTQKNFLLE